MEYVSLYPHLYGYSMNKHIITEISPLSEKDCLFIVERYKTEFTYPLHNHKEYELNFVENGAGVRRIVGDSVEEIGDYDLVLLCGDNLEHVWEQGSCQSKPDSGNYYTVFSGFDFPIILLRRSNSRLSVKCSIGRKRDCRSLCMR